MTNGYHAIAERAELDSYTERNAALMTHPEVIAEASKYEFTKENLCRAASQLACNLALVGEEDAALELSERLLNKMDADQESRLQTLSVLADSGSNLAGESLRAAIGLTRDDEGNTVVGDRVDLKDGPMFFLLLPLYKLGDESIAPHLHQIIENLEDDEAQRGVRLAAKLYEAGDESAYDLVKVTAEKARNYALTQAVEEEPSADDASDFAQILKGVTSALSPARSGTEGLYSHADITLKYLARDLLEKGDIQRADEIQSLILSGFDNAWFSAQRFGMGYDPDGKNLQAAKDYLGIYGEDSEGHNLEITSALVRGGDPEAIAAYEIVYNPQIDPEDEGIDLRSAADMLVALHLAGDTRAHDRLIKLLQGSDIAWKLPYSLEEMGFKDEAIEIAQRSLRASPSYMTGLTVLNLQYSAGAMAEVQNGYSEFDYNSADIVNSWARHLGKLAAHIKDIENTK